MIARPGPLALPLALVLAAAGVAACSGEPAPTAATFALRTIDTNGGACAGVGLESVLRGDPRDPSIAWLTSMVPGGGRTEAVWPRGDVAVFDPTLRIVDATGRTVMAEGDYVDGGCVTGPNAGGPLLILNPDDSFRLDCGPVQGFTCSAVLNTVRFQSRDWPHDRVAVFQVRDVGGGYTIVLENGQRVDGRAAMGG